MRWMKAEPSSTLMMLLKVPSVLATALTVMPHSMPRMAGDGLNQGQEYTILLMRKGMNVKEPTNLLYTFWRRKSFKIRNIEIEKWDNRYGIRPDAEGIMDNGERLLIEFYFSHKVDNKKRQIIVDNHLKCIEIDINYQALDKVELKEFLTGTDEDRKWIVSIPSPPQSKGESLSFSSKRNPLYEKTRDVLKEVFDEGTLMIHPFQHSLTKMDQPFDLREWGYDVCEVNTKYRGFRSDLLLYRSQKEKKEYISLNIRGRRRSDSCKHPKGLRIVDIVLGYATDTDDIKKRWKTGDLVSTFSATVYYRGFKP